MALDVIVRGGACSAEPLFYVHIMSASEMYLTFLRVLGHLENPTGSGAQFGQSKHIFEGPRVPTTNTD